MFVTGSRRRPTGGVPPGPPSRSAHGALRRAALGGLIAALLAPAASLTLTPVAAQEPTPPPAPGGEPPADAATPPEATPPGDGSPPGETPPAPETPTPPPPPQVPLAGLAGGTPAAIDHRLESALFAVDHLATWFATTTTLPELSLVAVEGAAATSATDALVAHIDEMVTARNGLTASVKASLDTAAQREALRLERTGLEEQRTTLRRERADTRARRSALRADLAAVRTALRETAVGVFMLDQRGASAALSQVGAYNGRQVLVVHVGATIDHLLARADELQADVDAATAEIGALDEALGAVAAELERVAEDLRRIAATLDALATAIADLQETRLRLEDALPGAIADAHRARAVAPAAGIDVPLVSLDAYMRAARGVGVHRPGCGVRWQVLAGIASVESRHGTHGGATIEPDGRVTGRRIFGPLLDGTLAGTAVIADSDRGTLDGDATFDRAVGPFQFLPSTWGRHGLDGDGDGVVDPHDLHDAALSAASYLCASSAMVSDADLERSILSYNRSRHYLADVTGRAARYIRSYAPPAPAFDPATVADGPDWRRAFVEATNALLAG